MKHGAMKVCLLIGVALIAVHGCSKKDSPAPDEPVAIKLGHVGHDHHLALFVAFDNAAEYSKRSGIDLKVLEDRKRYQLLQNGTQIANIEIVKVGGGSKMPTALAQGIIDVGFGGVPAVLASNDSGAPVKLISPLHSRGDMLVVKPDSPIETWEDFVNAAKSATIPIRVGYKSPMAVAKVVFEEALTHERISFSGDLADTDAKVHLINTKGGGKLNVSLDGDLIDAYVGNNPFPSIAVEKNIGKVVCDLEELPPGTFRNHPCCCIAANTDAINTKSDEIVALLTLFIQANETINSDLDKAVASASRWIGTSEAVERMSIPTSGYSLEPNDEWQAAIDKWIEAMNRLGIFTGPLKGATAQEVRQKAFDLSLLSKAKERLE